MCRSCTFFGLRGLEGKGGEHRGIGCSLMFGLRGLKGKGGGKSTSIVSITLPLPFPSKIVRKRRGRERKGLSILNFLIVTLLKNNYCPYGSKYKKDKMIKIHYALSHFPNYYQTK